MSGKVLIAWTNTLLAVVTPVAELQVTIALEDALTLTESVVHEPKTASVIVEPLDPTIAPPVSVDTPVTVSVLCVEMAPAAVVVAVPFTQIGPVDVMAVDEALASDDSPDTVSVLESVAAPVSVDAPVTVSVPPVEIFVLMVVAA